MRRSPKVSVIIPNYNHARFLEQRMTSVLHQSFQDFEILYLDDASTDNSDAVFARFRSNSRIQAFSNQTNSGSPFKQWNKGIQHARGEYIWIAESDDYADRQFLEWLVPELDAHPNVGLVYCQSWAVEHNGDIKARFDELCPLKRDTDRWTKNFINEGRDECRRYLLRKNTIPNASAVLFRRTIFERAGRVNEELKLNGDWLLWAKMLFLSDIGFIAKPLNYYRLPRPGTATNRAIEDGRNIEETFFVLTEIIAGLEGSERDSFPSFDHHIEAWIEAARRYPIPLRRHLNIYRAGRKLAQNFNVRLAEKLLKYLFRRTIVCIRLTLKLRTRLKSLLG